MKGKSELTSHFLQTFVSCGDAIPNVIKNQCKRRTVHNFSPQKLWFKSLSFPPVASEKNLSPCIDYLYRISSTKQTSGDNATTHVYGIFPCLSIQRLQNIFLSLGQVGSLRYRYRSYFISLFCARALLCFILYIKGNQDKAIVHITFLFFFHCALVFIKSKENKVIVHI